MIRRPPSSTLFPTPPLFRSPPTIRRRGGGTLPPCPSRFPTASSRVIPPTTPHAPSGTAPSTAGDRKSTRLNSSHANISYAVFCLKKKKHKKLIIYLIQFNIS